MDIPATITEVIFLPGLASIHAPSSLGLVLDDRTIVWGHILWPAHESPLAEEELGRIISEVLTPALHGQALRAWPEQIEQLSQLSYQAVREEIVPRPDQAETKKGITRRALLSGRLGAEVVDPSPPVTRKVTTTERLPPPLLFAASQALLAAAAQVQARPMAEVVAQTYDLALPASPCPLHIQLDTGSPLVDLPAAGEAVISLGYRTPAGAPAQILGKQGVILQRFLRVLKEQALSSFPAGAAPTVHLDLHGGLGELYDDNLGRILGAIIGLAAAASPLSLRLENVFAGADAAVLAERLKALQDLLRFRKTEVELAVGPVADLGTASALTHSKAVSWLRVAPGRVGALSVVAEIVLLARRQGCQVILDCTEAETGLVQTTLSHLALGLQVDAVAVQARPGAGAGALWDEMRRILVEREGGTASIRRL